MADTKSRFFSVKYTMNIGMGRFIPSVCYKLTQDIQSAVEKLAAEGGAKLYTEQVRFISGVPCPLKKPEQPKPAAESSSASPAQNAGETDKAGKPGKAGNRRNSFVGQREFS